MNPLILLARIETIRLRLAQTVEEINREIVPHLPAEGGGFPNLFVTPTDILAGVRCELDEVADDLEVLVDHLTPRGDDEDEDTRNSCALRALGLLAGGAR